MKKNLSYKITARIEAENGLALEQYAEQEGISVSKATRELLDEIIKLKGIKQ